MSTVPVLDEADSPMYPKTEEDCIVVWRPRYQRYEVWVAEMSPALKKLVWHFLGASESKTVCVDLAEEYLA